MHSKKTRETPLKIIKDGFFLSRLSYSDKLKLYNLENLESKRIKLNLVLLKLIHGFCDSNLSDFITWSSNVFSTCGSVLKSNTEQINCDTCRLFSLTGIFSFFDRECIIKFSCDGD